MAERRTRKAWSDDEKRLIRAQTRRPGVSVSQVTRRYDVNANLVFKWLRDPRFSPDEATEDEARFLPVEIVGESDGGRPAARSAEAGSTSSRRTDIACGSAALTISTPWRA